MNHFRTAMYSGLLASLLGLAVGSTAQTTSSSGALMARLSGAAEVPPVVSNGGGTVEVNLIQQTNVMTWTVTYSALSGPATAGHFHGPAMAGDNAGVVVPIAGSLVSPIKGAATLTAAQAADLMAGKWYMNLHTAANPNGEIRGQLTLQP
jgi:CHRD domain